MPFTLTVNELHCVLLYIFRLLEVEVVAIGHV